MVTLLIFGVILSSPMLAPMMAFVAGQNFSGKISEFLKLVPLLKIARLACTLVMLSLFYQNRWFARVSHR